MSSALSAAQSNPEALQLAQRAPEYLGQHSQNSMTDSIPFISSAESSDLWMTYEKLILACLRTGDEKSAHLCLERLIKRFGASNERVMGLRGLYQEAVIDNETALASVLKEYDSLLLEDPTNMPIRKRRVALLQNLSRFSEAISALVELLEISPTDAEAWAELSALYFSQGLYSQACFCLEEVLLICPNAWNIHARLGEILYISSFSAATDADGERALVEGVRRYSRSIEVCDGYLRGYYGLKLSTGRLLELGYKDSKGSSRSLTETDLSSRLPFKIVQQLNKKATAEIERIVRQYTAGDPGYGGYIESEIISAKALLDRGSSNT